MDPDADSFPPIGAPVSAWILALILSLTRHAGELPAYPGWAETDVQRLARYQSIADDIATVVLDPEEQPIVGGPHARAKTAAQLVAIASMESGFAPDADVGPCFRGLDGRGPRCDGGRAASVFQLHAGRHGTVAELFADRPRAVRAALHLVQRSVRACLTDGPEAALRIYAAGSCDRGREASAARVKLARRLLYSFPPKDLP